MTSAQSTAFQAGSGMTPGTLLTAIAGVVLVLAFVWVIWVTLGTFRAWQDGTGRGVRPDLGQRCAQASCSWCWVSI